MKNKHLILLFIALFGCSLVYAQAMDTKYSTINISEKNGRTRVIICNKDRKIKTCDNYTYYWYAYNCVMSTKGAYDGKLLQGAYASFYENNNLREKGQFKKGMKYGEWVTWFENGKVKEISHWSHSLKNGKRKVYNEDGDLKLEENYSEDIFNGPVITYDKGKIISQKLYKKGVEYVPRKTRVEKDSVKETKPAKADAPKAVANKTGSKDKKPKKSFFARIGCLFRTKKEGARDNNSNVPYQTRK